MVSCGRRCAGTRGRGRAGEKQTGEAEGRGAHGGADYASLLDFRYVKPPADLYALGATLYRLLTGYFPRDYRSDENWVLASLERPIIPLRTRVPTLPAPLCAVVETALETELDKRFHTADDMRAALEALAL